MQIINLKEKLQNELNYFNEEKPYTHFFIDYGQPSQMRNGLAHIFHDRA